MKSVILLFSILLTAHLVFAQTTEEEKVKSIRKEYQKIVANKPLYTKKEAYYTVEQAYWMNTNFTGYFDDKDNLVLLTFSSGEEGYWSDTEYYFKDNKVFFIFLHSGDPDGNEEENRIYIWNDKIIRALVKKKASTDDADFSHIENQPNKVIMDDMKAQSEIYIKGVDTERTNFFQALEK